jgi:hypothetical protein
MSPYRKSPVRMMDGRSMGRVALVLVAFLACAAPHADAITLYGATGGSTASNLYVIDQATGAATVVGPIGFAVTGLAFNPLTGVLYGASSTQSPSCSACLLTINPATGAGTAIGPFGGTISELAFAATGVLFGWFEGPDSLAQINLTTGAATVVGPSGLSTRGDGMSFNTAGTLYVMPRNNNGGLYTVNTTTGVPTLVATLSGAPSTAGAPVAAASFDPATGVLYAGINDFGTPPAFLVTVNTTTGAVTTVGTTVTGIDALVFVPTPTLSDSQEPGSVLVFPKFIRGTVTPPGDLVTPKTEFAIGAVCPPGATCAANAIVRLHFHWVCPQVGGICPETDFHGQTTINGKLVFNTEGTTSPGNFITPAPPCARGYLIVWAEDANGNPIKFDGLIGTAVLRESGTAAAAYTAIPIQADTALASGALIADFFTRGLVFDGTPGHYAAVTGRIYGDVSYDKLTAPFRSTFLTLLTLDVRSNRPNTSTFVDFVFYNSQEQGLSTSTQFTCWEEVQLSTQIDANLTALGLGSRKGVVISGPAQDVTGARRTLLGLVDTLEGPVLGNERMFIYGLANDSVGVPTVFVPEGITPTPD